VLFAQQLQIAQPGDRRGFRFGRHLHPLVGFAAQALMGLKPRPRPALRGRPAGGLSQRGVADFDDPPGQVRRRLVAVALEGKAGSPVRFALFAADRSPSIQSARESEKGHAI
jgi:hypothetical protein